MTLIEPSTMITDYVLAAACFGFALRLRVVVERRSPATVMWSLALAATGMAALLGGTYHGLFNDLSTTTGRVLWTLTLLSIGTASFGVGLGAAASELSPRAARPVALILLIKFATYAISIVMQPSFMMAVIDYGSVGLAAGVLAGISYRRHRRPAARWLLTAVVLSAVSAAFLVAPFGTRGYVDERDVYHIVQIAAMYALYRAAYSASRRPL